MWLSPAYSRGMIVGLSSAHRCKTLMTHSAAGFSWMRSFIYVSPSRHLSSEEGAEKEERKTTTQCSYWKYDRLLVMSRAFRTTAEIEAMLGCPQRIQTSKPPPDHKCVFLLVTLLWCFGFTMHRLILKGCFHLSAEDWKVLCAHLKSEFKVSHLQARFVTSQLVCRLEVS